MIDGVIPFTPKHNPTIAEWGNIVERALLGGNASVCLVEIQQGLKGLDYKFQMFFAPGMDDESKKGFIKALYLSVSAYIELTPGGASVAE